MQNEFVPHWLTFTVFENPNKALWLAMRLMGFDGVIPSDIFELVPSGGRGYTEIWQTSEGVRVYTCPTDGSVRYTVEIPGEVLQTVDWRVLQTVFQELNLSGVRWQVSRCDYAFDLHKSKLTPENLKNYLRMGGLVRTPTERSKWDWHGRTMAGIDGVPDDGNTQSFGVRSSERYVRVYDQHGFTRIELETKGKRANLLFRVLLCDSPSKWPQTALSFLLDFIDLPENDFWKQFVNGCVRAGIIVKTHMSMSVHRSLDWINKQVSPTLYMLAELYGIGAVSSMVLNAAGRLSSRQEAIIKLRPALTFY